VGWAIRILALLLAFGCMGGALGFRVIAQAEPELRRTLEQKLAERVSEPAARTIVGLAPVLGASYAAPALLAGGLVLLGFAVWPRGGKRKRAARAAATQAAANDAPKRLSRKEHRKLMKRANEFEAEKGPVAAAELLLGNGLRDEAFARFLAANELIRAAEIRHDQNRFEEAAELYERSGRSEGAGAIYAQLERHADAARCYETAGKWSVAGELHERVESHAEAGRCYAEIGFYRHAAQSFLKAGDTERAAQALKNAFDEEGGGATGENVQKQKEVRSIARKAAELYAKLGRLDEAENLLVRAGLPGAAAQVAMRAGAYDRAAELFARTSRLDLAADALERAGDTKRAAKFRGEFLREQGKFAEAVTCLEQAGEPGDAADVHRRLERFDEAGRCYLEAKDYAAAAEMFQVGELPERAGEAFEQAGDFVRAAECYQQSGNLDRQAELLERGGQTFEAGCVYATLERVDDAIRLLQRIEEPDEHYTEACSRLGKLFEKKGMHSLSVQKLEQAASGQAIGRRNVEAFYDLACAQERSGELEGAVEIFEKILGFDYHHADVAERLERGKQQLAQSPRAAPEASGAPLAASARSDRYRIQRELGRGGMGVVYLARDTVLDREVAYKVLPEGLRGNANALRSFLREAKAAAQLNHPHIVTVYDAGESEQGFYLAMEYVDGTTLKDILDRRGPLSQSGLSYVARQMLDALAYAHSRRVVHRDIKTANTMWTSEKQVKIMDFGLAKLMEEVRNATTLVSGTPFYMSPEQTLGRNVDHRTDLYSLGVTLFELATGELPFRKGNVPYHHVHTAPPDPRSLRPQLPEPFAGLILRCLEKDPAQRFQSAEEMRGALDRLATQAASGNSA
jgi:tetratricopeptide (TPR) repeat protein